MAGFVVGVDGGCGRPVCGVAFATAAQAEHAAAEAKAAAAAYEAVFAMTVPPPVIAANRALLMALIVTNFFGQNNPAIAATEAHYVEMWAQDAAAMYGYAEGSAAASMLAPFTAPPHTTNLAGLAGQATALTQASATSAPMNAQTTLLQLIQAILSALQQLASRNPFSGIPFVGPSVWGSVGPPNLATRIVGLVRRAQAAASQLVEGDLESVPGPWVGPGPLQPNLAGAGVLGGLYGGPAGVSASLGQADSIGGLSVPQSWIAAAPAISPATMVTPLANVSAAPAYAVAGTGTPWREMSLAPGAQWVVLFPGPAAP